MMSRTTNPDKILNMIGQHLLLCSSYLIVIRTFTEVKKRKVELLSRFYRSFDGKEELVVGAEGYVSKVVLECCTRC